MKLILAGGPGSGKGEAAKYLTESYPELHYVGMGDIVRDQIKQQTQYGTLCNKCVSKGLLLTNYLADKLWETAIQHHNHECAWWLADGYPRSIGQARNFVKRGYEFDLLLHLDVSQRTMRQRMLKRGRNDDVTKVIERRIEVFVKRTLPAIMHIKELFPKKYVRINARGSIWDTNENILIALAKCGKGMLP